MGNRTVESDKVASQGSSGVETNEIYEQQSVNELQINFPDVSRLACLWMRINFEQKRKKPVR